MMSLNKAVAEISKEMGLPDNFLSRLLQEDDWSFVIKTHAFLEALLTYAISEAVHRPELSEVFAHLNMSDTRCGKVRFARSMELIGGDGQRFLRKFSELRDDLAHDVRNVSFSFAKHVSHFDRNQKNSFVESFGYFASEEDMKNHGEIVKELVLNDTKHAIWYSVLHFSGILWWKKELAKLTTLKQAISSDLKSKSA